MSILHYIGIFEALFLALLLFNKKERNISDYFLALYFIVFGISILFDFLERYNVENNYKYPFLILITPPLAILHGPILWFYIKSITTVHFKFKPIYLLHLLPFVFLTINLMFSIYLKPNAIKIDVVKYEIFKNWLNYKIGVLLITTILFFYLGWSLTMIIQYSNKAPQLFSNIDEYQIQWIKVLFISAFVFYSIFVTINFLDLVFRFISFRDFQFISFAFGSLFVLFLGFYGHQQNNVFTSNYTVSKSTVNLISNYSDFDHIQDMKIKDFIERLLNFMNTEKPFLNPNLNVEQLANQLSVSPIYLSEILNNKMSINFLDFINSYRIDEFKRIITLPQNQNIKIAALANDVGFNSKATFNRVFKKKMHITPSAYKQKVDK